MLENELFAFLEGTTDAAFSVNQQGEILSWNWRPNGCLGIPLPRSWAKAVRRYCTAAVFLVRKCVGRVAVFWSAPVGERRSRISICRSVCIPGSVYGSTCRQ